MREMRTIVRGNATGDVRESVHPDGTVSANVRVAVNSSYFDPEKGGYTDRKTEFVTVYMRRSLARNALASVQKGQPLLITGRIGTSEWTDDNGTERRDLTIQAESIGHDLTFGRSVFAKASRKGEVPDVDEKTGEVIKLGSTAPKADAAEQRDEENEEVGAPF